MAERNPPDLDLARRIVDLMNEAIAMDPVAIAQLVDYRVPLVEGRTLKLFEEHPTIQIGEDESGNDAIGILGLFNGLCGKYANNRGPVEAVCDEEGVPISFRVGQDPEG